MKILLSWLNEYAKDPFGAEVKFGDPTSTTEVEDVSTVLTQLGLEVQSAIAIGETVDGVVAAKVLRREQHPDAAKVQRVWVDAGDGEERHVWCGAHNFTEGDIVPLATLGTTMPNGMTIERRGILGIDSEGMLCAAEELGLTSDDDGIMLLPEGTALGTPYGDVLGITPDILFDLDVTRNRPDCFGYVGIARDLAPQQMGVEFAPPQPPEPVLGPEHSAPVTLIDGDRCGRFTSAVLSGVAVQPSPVWMQRRLDAAGMRPINNVVDASNYVMLELSQPSHAYDLDTLGGKGFRVRSATAGETLTTLDGVERTLDERDVLICDADDVAIGIGGVMGGLNTEVTATTTTVALEMAWFAETPILQTASRHGLRSEASARYERGVDPYGIDRARNRFVELLSETCPDLVMHAGVCDERGAGLPDEHRSVSVRVTQINRIVGTELTGDDLPGLLDPIGFTVSGVGDTRTVSIPSWRTDAATEIDVVEEVARHYGYHNVAKRVPKSPSHGGLTVRQQRRRHLRQVLLGLGITEAMPNPFLAPGTLAMADLDGPTIKITNPLVVEESVLRTSLRPGLLRAIAYNESHRQEGVKLFEIGHVYPPGEGADLPDEYEALCVVLAGADAPAAMQLWAEVSGALGAGARVDQARVPRGLHPTRSATLQAGKNPSGAVGEVDPGVLQRFGVHERVAILEINLDEFLAREPKPSRWKPVSKFPSSDLDMAFVLPDTVPAEKLTKAIRQGAGVLLADLSLFDSFRGGSVGSECRSLAFRLRLQAADRNLTDGDVASVREKCEAAAAKLGAELRG